MMMNPYTIPIRLGGFPKTLPAFIEVSAGSRNKYEYNKKAGMLMLDRVLHSAVFYPYDYGFFPQTLCEDGDPLDVLVMGTSPLVPGCIAMVRPICYMIMEDEGKREKVLAVLANDPAFSHVKSIVIFHRTNFEITQFLRHTSLEKDKWVNVGDWKDVDDTLELVKATHEKYIQNQTLE